jgi:glycosyltransferase involved in cell wall biosynthesis
MSNRRNDQKIIEVCIMEKISIVIPTYNVAGYLEQTPESLAAQTRPFELWLIDDHSTDQSAQLGMQLLLSTGMTR